MTIGSKEVLIAWLCYDCHFPHHNPRKQDCSNCGSDRQPAKEPTNFVRSKFRLEPPTAHRCAVCLGTACYVKGGAQVAARIEQRLGVRLDDPAGDGVWALQHVSCLGACGQAPVLVVDGELMTRLPVDQPEALDARLEAAGLPQRTTT